MAVSKTGTDTTQAIYTCQNEKWVYLQKWLYKQAGDHHKRDSPCKYETFQGLFASSKDPLSKSSLTTFTSRKTVDSY